MIPLAGLAPPVEPMAPSPERVLADTILTAFPLRGEGRPVSSGTIPLSFREPLVLAAKQHGLAALLYAALADVDISDLDAPFQELRDTYLRSRMAARLGYDALGELLEAFARRKIAVLVLKGAALSPLLYPEPGLRTFGDIDLLIRRDDLAAAQQIMEGAGYRILSERHEGFSEQFLKSLNYVHGERVGLAVELHWHLFVPVYYRRRLAPELFWEHPMACAPGTRNMFTLAPTPQLLYLCAHARLNHTRLRLIWLYDIALLLERYGGEIDWDEFVRVAQALELAPAAAQILEWATEWWGTAVPDEPLALLRGTPSRTAARLVYALVTSPQPEARVFADVFYQTGLRNKLTYAVQLLLPSRAYMQNRHPDDPMLRLPIRYVQRVWRITGMVARSLWVTLTRS